MRKGYRKEFPKPLLCVTDLPEYPACDSQQETLVCVHIAKEKEEGCLAPARWRRSSGTSKMEKELLALSLALTYLLGFMFQPLLFCVRSSLKLTQLPTDYSDYAPTSLNKVYTLAV